MRVFRACPVPDVGSSAACRGSKFHSLLKAQIPWSQGKMQGIFSIQSFFAKICLENICEFSCLRMNSLLEQRREFFCQRRELIRRAGNRREFDATPIRSTPTPPIAPKCFLVVDKKIPELGTYGSGRGDAQGRSAMGVPTAILRTGRRGSKIGRVPRSVISSPAKFASKDTPLRWPKARSCHPGGPCLRALRAVGGRPSRIAKSHALSKYCDRAIQKELSVHRSHAESEVSLLVDPNVCRITSERFSPARYAAD